MRKTFLAALTLATLASTGAFADTLTLGSATRAPTFANPSGNVSAVADIGSATRAPVYALTAGNGQVVTAIGSASRAPTFAQVPERNATVSLAD